MATVTYFDMAENDYNFLKDDYERGKVGNVMCYASQSICEGYLKHIIDKYYIGDENTTDVLRTHSIKILKKFVSTNISNFICDWPKVLCVDGYYFSARYPGADSFIVDEDDVQEAWGAVEELRKSVLNFMQYDKEAVSSDIVIEQTMNSKEIKSFD